jgi:hypothetical protein
MQMQPASSPSPQFPMQELEQIESIIQALSQWFTTLEGRRAVLLAQLDYLTRPQPVPPRLVTKTTRRGFEYRGVLYEHHNCIGIYVDLLSLLWTKFPDRREAMARAMGRHGRIRPYVAKTRVELFPGQTQAFAHRYGRTLVDDWYVDTNLSSRQMPPILSTAIAISGFELGKEVKIYWRQTQLK